MLVFCGDGLRDILPNRAHFEQVLAVRGNCDWSPFPGIQAQATARFHGLTVLVAHGHHHRVKRDTNALLYAALQAQATVVCYGHTHIPKGVWQKGVLLLNPGALQDGRYALLEMGEEGTVSLSLCRL